MQQRIITSRSNPAVKRLRLLAHAHTRRKSSTFLIEGPKFIHDAINARINLLTLVVSENYKGLLPRTGENTKLLRVSRQLYGELSDTSSPQGMIAEAKRRWSKVADIAATGKHILVAWGVQDPGNVGTMVRSCAAFAMGGFIAGGKTADPFSPKAVRASAGTVLRYPVAAAAQLAKLLRALHEAGYATYWTGTHAPLTLRKILRGSPVAVFIGSEGRGFSQKDSAMIGRGVCVKIASEVESLNAGVTGSIVAYELAGTSGWICG